MSFCDQCGTLLSFKPVNGKSKPWCSNCGFVKQEVDTEVYITKKKIDHTASEPVIIDHSARIEELKKELGEKEAGMACPRCKNFYFTRQIVVTRGDEGGKSIFNCLVCGYTFRRPIFVNRKEKKQ
ncbi:MAG: hypothetical protein ACFFDT_03575 [Candidatus Hodarchaeota archaeon]